MYNKDFEFSNLDIIKMWRNREDIEMKLSEDLYEMLSLNGYSLEKMRSI